MFTIKVTYRGQTRKHTFDSNNGFPSYDQIYTQICRLFPTVRSYYLSRLLFFPDASQPPHILIGKEVHNSLDYNKCIRHHKDRVWRHGLLRFNICDSQQSFGEAGQIPVISIDAQPSQSHRRSWGPTSNPFLMSPFPSAPLPGAPEPMDVDRSNFHFNPMRPDLRVAQPELSRSFRQNRNFMPNPSACCSVAKGREDIRKMLDNFQETLNTVLATNLAAPLPLGSNPSASNTRPGDSFESAPPSSLCSVCTKNVSNSLRGPDSWYSCVHCRVVMCDGCQSVTKANFCLSTLGSHEMQQGCSFMDGNSALPIPRLPDPWIRELPTRPASIPANGHHRDGQMPNVTPSNPVIHDNVKCDKCEVIIQGIRHKCLDCPDYDLCTPCISSGAAESHNPFHEFYEITEPGRVVVHTVYSGDGEREARASSRPAAPTPTAAARQPAIHHANCDLCNSRILGDRYKCQTCPDYDTCGSCFNITQDQHPKHPFVRITNVDDYIRRNSVAKPIHNATCDGCSQTIRGVRYKCMHPECPDYDLCENCEALPIPVHPQIHPMLKMTTPDTVVPTVYRVGQTTLIGHDIPPYRHHHGVDIGANSNVDIPSLMPGDDVRSSPSPILNPVEEEHRASTPKPGHSYPPWMNVDTYTPRDDAQPEPQTPLARPPLPPKPEMMSNPSWASIQGLYMPPVTNPFSDGFAASADMESSEKVMTGERDISLPSVPRHIPNPWPTTNATERQELLELISEFSNLPASSNAPRRPMMEEIAAPAANTSLLEMSSVESSMYIQSHKEAFSETISQATQSQVREFLPNVPIMTTDLFNSLFPSLDGEVTPETRDDGIAKTESPQSNEQGYTAVSTSGTTTPPVDIGNPSFGNFSASMSHLLRELEKISPVPSNHPESTLSGGTASKKTASVAESSLSHEVLLNAPEEVGASFERVPRSFSDVMDDLFPTRKLQPDSALVTAMESRVPLSAAFIEDVTVPDGQIFPPGAEFMKCWKLLNDSVRDWPESTELVFVAGELLAAEKAPASMTVALGKVAAGAEVDVWTGELKAPDAPGRYVGYWRLKADGEVFGNSLWIEITVKEADSRHSSDVSLAASAIIMPVASSVEQSEVTASAAGHANSFSTSTVSTEDNVSDAGSDISLISLPSSPSEDEDEDDDLWHDSRSQNTAERAAAAAARAAASRASPASALDFVLLYDEESSSEGDK